MVTLVNRAKVNTTTTGTGTINLGSAVDGYQTFADAGVVNTNVVRYTIEDGEAWEIGSGTYSSGTLTRSLDESSTGSLLNLSGEAVVYVTATGSDLLQPSDIGSTVQGYDANIVSDSSYVHTDNNYTTTEKNKLAGIEAGATADQTPAQILTAIKTVDGSGSGLDADLLDGVQGGGYARYDASGTLSNALASAAWVANYSGSTNVDHVWHDEAANAWNFNSDSTYKGTANSRVNAGSFYAGGNVVWNAGNDGSGSGLDADTVDGVHADALKQAVNATALTSSDSIDSVTDGWYRWHNSGPTGAYADYMVMVQSTDGAQPTQLTFGTTNHIIAVRRKDSGVWSSWAKMWSNENDGSGSGLDADLLDGNHASAFSTLSGSNTFSGLNRFSNLRFADATTNDYNDYDELTAILHRKESASAFRPVSNIEYWNGSSWVSTTALDSIIPTLLTGDSQNEGSIPNTYKRFRFTIQLSATYLGGFWIVSERHWSSGGDISRSYDMKLELGNSSMSTINNTSSFTVGANVYGYNKLLTWHYPNQYMRVEYDFSTYVGSIPLVRFDAYNVYGRGSGGLSGDTPFNWNSTTLNTPIPTLRLNGNTVWNAGNDGSGSGLDADTVDGLQASQFIRSDATDTATGVVTFSDRIQAHEIRTNTGQELILSAGESYLYATGQTNEYVYLNGDNGVQINTSPDNWSSGWAGRDTFTFSSNGFQFPDGTTQTTAAPATEQDYGLITGALTASNDYGALT